VPFQREAEAILGEWRAVERELEVVDPRSPEAEALQAEAARLRDAYQRIIRMQRETGGSAPPPFPEPSPSNWDTAVCATAGVSITHYSRRRL
jgi:hypothetical protein